MARFSKADLKKISVLQKKFGISRNEAAKEFVKRGF